jgi:hypothetical protein
MLKTENENLVRKNNEMRVAITNFEAEMSRRGSNFDQNLNVLTR